MACAKCGRDGALIGSPDGDVCAEGCPSPIGVAQAPGVVTVSADELQRIVGLAGAARPPARPTAGPFATLAAIGEMLEPLARDEQIRVLKTCASLLGIDAELYEALGK